MGDQPCDTLLVRHLAARRLGPQNSIAFVVWLSLYSVVTGHWSAWHGQPGDEAVLDSDGGSDGAQGSLDLLAVVVPEGTDPQKAESLTAPGTDVDVVEATEDH